MRIKITFVALVVLAVALAGCAKKPEATIAITPGADGFKGVQAIGMTFEWKFDGDNVVFHVKSPGKGWIGIGIDPTSLMKEADFILSYVKDGTAVAADQYGSQLTNHEKDIDLGGTDNVTVISGSESDSGTEVVFSIPANSGDKYDKVLASGSEHTILLAYSEADDFETQHTPAARTKIKLTL